MRTFSTFSNFSILHLLWFSSSSALVWFDVWKHLCPVHTHSKTQNLFNIPIFCPCLYIDCLWEVQYMLFYCFLLYCVAMYYILWYCIVLYCTGLYCTVLYCTVLYWIVLYCIVLYSILLYCIVLYCNVLYCIVLYCIVLHCTCDLFTPLSYYVSWVRKQ